MKARHPRTWSIAAQLLLVATVPAAVMFVAISTVLYTSGEAEARRALDERGAALAAAFGAASQYGVVSGQRALLEAGARQMLELDDAIVGVDLKDREGRALVSVTSGSRERSISFERPIVTASMDVNVFDFDRGPHVAGPVVREATSVRQTIDGFVSVHMSDASIAGEKRKRLAASAVLVFVAALISSAVGLLLVRRLLGTMSSIVLAVREIRKGRFDVQFERKSGGELGELQIAVVDMSRALERRQDEIQSLVDARTAELQMALERAAAADAEKRRLLVRNDTLVEEERRRIAVEIHDDLNASVLAIKHNAMHIGALATGPATPEFMRQIELTARAMEMSAQQIYSLGRAITKRLRPEVLEMLGLTSALDDLVRQFNELNTNCLFELNADADFPVLRGVLGISCYRLVQEGLTNIAKHAGATRALVLLEAFQDEQLIMITIMDDGIGFDVNAVRGGLGLAGMRERAESANGSLTITTQPGQGAIVALSMPIPISTSAIE